MKLSVLNEVGQTLYPVYGPDGEVTTMTTEPVMTEAIAVDEQPTAAPSLTIEDAAPVGLAQHTMTLPSARAQGLAKEGHVFMGWTTTRGSMLVEPGMQPGDTFVIPKEGVNLYPIWQPESKATAKAPTPVVGGGTPTPPAAPGDGDGGIPPISSPYGENRRLIVVIPAHNEGDIIADTLDHVLDQTRMPDRIVVIADNCTDNTVDIALAYQDAYPDLIAVHETVGNSTRKVGALNQAWDLYGDAADYWMAVDADTRITRVSIQQLEEEVLSNRKIAGVMCRYSFNQSEAKSGLVSNFLVRMQRIEFASWNRDILHRHRNTYVLGGQATLLRVSALADVTTTLRRPCPWTVESQVEDMELTWQLQALGYSTLMSATARAWAGPMLTFKSLFAQRRKWDSGIIKLLRRDGMNDTTKYPWWLQFKMGLDMTIRVMFAVLFLTALTLHAFVWLWLWAIPPVLAALLNLDIAASMPKRTGSDVFAGATLILVEIYLWFRIAAWFVSWMSELSGSDVDRWEAQYKAENKKTVSTAVRAPRAMVAQTRKVSA